MAEIRPRIVGSEMEWGVAGRLVDQADFRELNYISSVPTYLHPDVQQVNGMLSNGSRIYVDYNSKLEYATPEDTSFESAVAGEFAGEQIVIDAFYRCLKANEKYETIKLRKRVVDSRNTTWGYHVNFSTDRDEARAAGDRRLLSLHYATSLPMLGSGAIVPERTTNNLRFTLGQKINGLACDISSATTSNKGIINTRDEPLADSARFRRVHLTSTDPHISPWATYMTYGTYSLVLRAIEQGYGDELDVTSSGESTHPILDLARQNNYDLTMRGVVHEINGKTMRQLDVQREILDIVAKTDHTDEEAIVLKEWQKAVDTLEANPSDLLYKSDALTRLHLMRSRIERKGGDPDDTASNTALIFDESYDMIAKIHRDDESARASYDTSLPGALRASRMQGYGSEPEVVAARMFTPPETTRAKIRGEAILRGASGASWDYYTDISKQRHQLLDPYQTEE